MRPFIKRCRHCVAAQLAAAVILVTAQLAAAQEPLKNFIMHGASKPVAAVNFEDGQGRMRSLADFKGKVVVLNIWATWCVPCRSEMPALDRLQAIAGGGDFEVLPISIDRGGIEAVRKFYTAIGVRSLAMYVDSSGQVVRDLGAIGVPTTLIIDRAGNEVGRVIGPAEWDAPAIIEVLKTIMLKQSHTAEAGGLNERIPSTNKESRPGSLMRGMEWLKAFFIR